MVLPESARNVEGTLTWAGDNARFFVELLFNDRALGEAYSLTTSEHHTWEEIAEYYKDLRDMKVIWVDQDELGNNKLVIDNSKYLDVIVRISNDSQYR